MKNPCRIAMILVIFCVSFLTFFSSPASAQSVVKVGAGEYLTTYLMSDGTVRVSSQATITPVLKSYAGLASIVDVQGGQYHVTALDQQGKVYKLSNNASFVMTTNDEFGVPFTGNFLVRGFWQSNVSLRGADSSLWYWGIADPMNYAGGATITAPKKLVMPAGKRFIKVETGANSTLGDSYILALASDNTVWKYSRGNANPVQVSIPGETIADIAALGSNAQVLLTKSNQIFAAGYLSSYVGTVGNSSTFQNVTAAWVNAGVKFPIKELVANSSTLHIIDANDHMFGSGTNVQGEVGTGVEYSPYRIAGPQGGVFGYGFSNGLLLTPPTQIQGKFKNINTSTTITFYLYAQDLGSNWYSWGRNKAFSLGNGKSLGPYAGWGGTGDYAAYPNALDVPMPKRVNPASVVWTLQNFDPNDNIPPVVGAGINQYLNSVTSTTLYGKAFQQEFSIASQVWTKVSGPAGGTITSPTSSNTTITGLSNGTYVYGFAATNSKGQTSTDEVSIIVGGTITPAANVLPTVNAGADQAITLPVSTATLTGSAADADGTISSYAWSKVSGPSGGNIVNTATASTGINALVAGIYVYSLKVTDNAGGTATASIRITVNAVGNVLPTVNAGVDQAITLPSSTVTLTGTAADADGTISSFAWARVAGPASETIANAGAAVTDVNGLTQGTYLYQLTVTDNNGGIGKDTVQVVVSNADAAVLLPAVNPANTVNGLDYQYYEGSWSVLPQFSTLTPVKSGNTSNFNISLANRTTQFGFSFNGYITIPADGQYKFYTSSDDGSNLYIDDLLTVANDGLHGNTERSGVIGLKAGKHAIRGVFFQQAGQQLFTVSYEGNGIIKQLIPASILHRVNQLPTANVLPTVNAGVDQAITLPSSTVTLTGTAADADGTISSFAWARVAGPASETIANAGAAVTDVNGLTQGTYLYQLTVTDNNGGIGKDTVQVVVSNADAAVLLPAVNPANTVNGLDYQYYEGSWSVLPQFSTLTPVKSGNTSNFNISLANRTTQFGFSFNGYITIPADGQYKFYTSSDDGSNLYIDDLLTVANDGLHGNTERSGVIGLKAGKHAIRGVFFQQAGQQLFTVSYEGNGIIKQLIPASILHRVNQLPTANAGAPKVFTGETLVEMDANPVSVYPNPFVGSFKVQLGQKAAGEYVLKLSASTGQTVFYKKVNKPAGSVVETINVGNLTSGTYILEIISVANGSKSVHKVIKN